MYFPQCTFVWKMLCSYIYKSYGSNFLLFGIFTLYLPEVAQQDETRISLLCVQ